MDPVALGSGEFSYICPDLSLPSPGIDVNISHIYKEGQNFNYRYGHGWMLNYHWRIKTYQNGDAIVVGGGRRELYTYHSSTSTYTTPAGIFDKLEQNANGTWTLHRANNIKYEFDVDKKLVAIVDRHNNQITFTYNAAGLIPVRGFPVFAGSSPATGLVLSGLDYRLDRITDTVGRHIDLAYDSITGMLTGLTDYYGRTVSYGYDPNTNDLLTITYPASTQFPSGRVKELIYDTDHRIVSIKDAKGQTFVTNHYDNEGRVHQQDLGTGSGTFDYSVANQNTFTDKEGNVTRFLLNADGMVTSQEQFTKGLRTGEPASYLTTIVYNTNNLPTWIFYPEGNGVKYIYDSSNTDARARKNILTVRRKENMSACDYDPVDIYVTFTYESQFNRVKTITDPRGYVTTLTYDYELPTSDSRYGTVGNVARVSLPTTSAGMQEILYRYNSRGQVTEVEVAEAGTANSVITTYDYNALGQLTMMTGDDGGIDAETVITYDSYGYPDTITDPNNNVTDFNYNEIGWLVQMTDPRAYVTKYTYNANGNTTRVENQANAAATTWQTTDYTYTLMNKIDTITDPLNRVTDFGYDDNNQLTSILDAEGNTTTHEYDERNLLFRELDANTPQGITRYDYDLNGNLVTLTDAEGNATTYAYDGFGRVNTKTYANSSAVGYMYDKNSNLTQFTPPGSDPVALVYDALNRLTNKNFTNNTHLNATFIYDGYGRLSTASVAGGVNYPASLVSYAYDDLHRVATTTQRLNNTDYTISYLHNAGGNQTRMIYPSTKQIDYGYDAADNMTTITQNNSLLTQYNYDVLGRRDYKDLTATVTQRADYTFDLANQLSSIANTALPSTTIGDFSYPVYDNVGNRKQMVSPFGTVNYGYNDIYELTSVTGAQTHSYDYDLVGNRETVDSVVYNENNINQYTNVGGTNFTYDANANLTFDGNNTYTYDETNRLLTIVNGLSSASYAYDAFNRRIRKIVNGTATWFVYDGDEVIAEYSSSGSLISEYVMGSRIDEVLTMERGGTYFYHYDGLGSVRVVTNGSGNIVEKYDYDPYGNPTIFDPSNTTLSTSAIDNPYMFTGRRWDAESEIYYYRARVYDPVLGRFLQRDPLGYVDSMNLYSYVRNNPLNFVDPYGLAKFDIDGEQYYIHKYDPDPLPSKPHAHVGSPNSKIKVKLPTGEIYDKATDTGKKLAKKTLRRLLSKAAQTGLIILLGTIGILLEIAEFAIAADIAEAPSPEENPYPPEADKKDSEENMDLNLSDEQSLKTEEINDDSLSSQMCYF